MPPKRKATPAVAATITPAVGVENVTSLPPGVNITWQLEDKTKDMWVVFSTEVQDALTAAAMSSRKQLNLKAGPRSALTVDMVKMVQRTSKGAEKRVRGLVEKKEVLSSWEVKDGEEWQPLQVGVGARLEQVLDISSSVVVGGIKYDLDKMCRDDKTQVRREKQVVKNFVKSSITGNIKVAEQQEEDEEEEASPAKKVKVKSVKKSIKKDPEDDEESKPVMKSVMMKGLAPVDTECPHLASYHVYCEGKVVWDAMLNQTNIQNNNNKYYLIQLLESDNMGSFCVWMRWGRVGYKGQTSWTTCGQDKEKAKGVFEKKFADKTVNQWEDRDHFEKHAGKYDLVKMDYSAGSSTDEVDSVLPVKKEGGSVSPTPESTLHSSVQDLISLICNIQTMEQAVMEMEYDTKKAPLGKVTTEQISAGYQSLKSISDCITKGKTSGAEITQACNDFYTRIPHEFGMRTPPLIKTNEKVKAKLQLLEALADIQVALKILSSVEDEGLHPVDRRYKQLDVNIGPLERKSEQWKMVEHSIHSTHASTHSMYSMEVQEVFSLDKTNEMAQFEDRGNTKLLYHGSRLSNWAGILSQGLRIAPPEAPSTGYMFGKGVYFADMSSKSANYCFTTRSHPVGLLLLCEVSLGNSNKLVAADYEASQLPSGTHSVQGMGKIEPAGYKKMKNGLELPVGPPKDTKVVNKKGYTLNYNEFIVYDTKQIKMKYLAKVKFNYKI